VLNRAAQARYGIRRLPKRLERVGEEEGRVLMIVLGIDAAWTEGGSSGVALLSTSLGNRKILHVAPSYEAFIKNDAHRDPNFWHKPNGGSPNVGHLLAAAEKIANRPVDVVAIDMPVSNRPIVGRRTADQAISREFGAAGASTHSPGLARPGSYGQHITNDLNRAGYSIVTANSRSPLCLIEVFPLAALVRLMRLAKRPGYKTAKTLKYWPGQSVAERGKRLLLSWQEIETTLELEVGPLGFEMPSNFSSFASLKPFEDALDAVICCWIGARFAEGTAELFGDNDAAIWVPVILPD
jgi:predicted RNase H-like nuclease